MVKTCISVNCMHNVVLQISRTFLSCRTETLYSLHNFPFLFPYPLITTILVLVSMSLIILLFVFLLWQFFFLTLKIHCNNFLFHFKRGQSHNLLKHLGCFFVQVTETLIQTETILTSNLTGGLEDRKDKVQYVHLLMPLLYSSPSLSSFCGWPSS